MLFSHQQVELKHLLTITTFIFLEKFVKIISRPLKNCKKQKEFRRHFN
jgi:hypothetical protein